MSKVKEVLGRLTGDRAVEAKGRAERSTADGDEPSEQLQQEAEERVRAEHGDLGVDEVPEGSKQGG